MLKRFFERFTSKPPLTSEAVLAAGLSVDPAQRDLAELFPIIIPFEASASGWPGPSEQIGHLPFCTAWAICGPLNTFFYVSDRDAGYWEAKGINWRARAMANLVAKSQEYPASGHKMGDDGRPFLKVMLHNDAIGPSRLLLPSLFNDDLGMGYQVALPERTCAIAFRNTLSAGEEADVAAMIDGCFAHGTEPMSPERFPAASFWRRAADAA